MSFENFKLVVLSRIAEHKQKEAEREAAIKAQAEANAKAKLEAEAKKTAEPVNNVINEADFSKHVAGGKEQEVDILEHGYPVTKEINNRQCPSQTNLITTISLAYKVDYNTAYDWLTATFSNQAKAA